MPTPADQFVAHCMELLDALGNVRSRRMFGGHGLYVDDLFVAIIAFDRLYLKTDAQTRQRFEQARCEPFVYAAKGRAISLSYWSAPDEAMESAALMRPWAELALEAALRARAARKPREAIRERTPVKTAAMSPARHAAGAKARR
jgi:DNA transformation protein and related proteins